MKSGVPEYCAGSGRSVPLEEDDSGPFQGHPSARCPFCGLIDLTVKIESVPDGIRLGRLSLHRLRPPVDEELIAQLVELDRKKKLRCEGSGELVELVGLREGQSALCPKCGYVDPFPPDVAERAGKAIGRVRPHNPRTAALSGSVDDLNEPLSTEPSERKS